MPALFYATSKQLIARRHLAAALAGTVRRMPAAADAAADADVIGWGVKANTRAARQWAAGHARRFWALEDGFIRSIGLGVSGAEPFGFVVDGSGIYYDAGAPSDLETLIRSNLAPDPQAEALRLRLVALRASKYNHCWRPPALPSATRRRILLVDQTAGDLSVQLGGGDAACFASMLAVARATGDELLVKVHPDVIAGKRRGYLAALDLTGCTVVGHDCNPLELVLAVDEVFTVTSQLGFEALLAGRPVRCFGLPFYAGWGLTTDEKACPRRGVKRTLDQVFWAAYGRYTRYVDPVTGQPCDLARILERIAVHKQIAAEPGRRLWAFGFSLRKRRLIPPWLPTHELRFVSSRRQALRRGATHGDGVLAWGMRNDGEAGSLAQQLAVPVSRMEDGFIRSVGLGSDLVRPHSLVYDATGIYFDPQLPNDLETLLGRHPFSHHDRTRGAALIELLRAQRVTKYNTGDRTPLTLPPAAAGRRIVLVPGQVEDDQSILRGTSDIRTNLALLRAARAAEPAAFLIYKPHPDVLAGNRRGAAADPSDGCADLVVRDQDMATCLAAVDAVHTMTSLAGFEALIHGKAVATYGLPFYAGWGLTQDRTTSPRRGRDLTVAELVYACIVLYPRYMDPASGLFSTPESVVETLAKQRNSAKDHRQSNARWYYWVQQMINAFK